MSANEFAKQGDDESHANSSSQPTILSASINKCINDEVKKSDCTLEDKSPVMSYSCTAENTERITSTENNESATTSDKQPLISLSASLVENSAVSEIEENNATCLFQQQESKPAITSTLHYSSESTEVRNNSEIVKNHNLIESALLDHNDNGKTDSIVPSTNQILVASSSASTVSSSDEEEEQKEQAADVAEQDDEKLQQLLLFPSARSPSHNSSNYSIDSSSHDQQQSEQIALVEGSEPRKQGKKRKKSSTTPTANRKIKLDPEAQRQYQRVQQQRAHANTLVHRALFDELGVDREFAPQDSVRIGDNVFSVEVIPGSRLRNEILEDLLSLTRANMQQLYDATGSAFWSWNDNNKRGELRNERMRWAILYCDGSEGIDTPESNVRGIVGFAAFRFTAEQGIPHTYLHELQISSKIQGQGLGQLLMKTIESTSISTGMQLILLTVFSSNTGAIRFYERLGFKIDEASPGPCYNLPRNENLSPYEIMSKVLDDAVQQHPCEEPGCSYKCRYQDTLLQHAGFAHGKPWPHPCTFPGCNGGTVHLHQLQKHNELKHAIIKPSSCNDLSQPEENQSYINTRVTLKTNGRKGTVIKLGEKGFYTVRMDGPTLETIVCRATSFLGHQSTPAKRKKKTIDPDHELALKLQYEDGWSRKSNRTNKASFSSLQ